MTSNSNPTSINQATNLNLNNMENNKKQSRNSSGNASNNNYMSSPNSYNNGNANNHYNNNNGNTRYNNNQQQGNNNNNNNNYNGGSGRRHMEKKKNSNGPNGINSNMTPTVVGGGNGNLQQNNLTAIPPTLSYPYVQTIPTGIPTAVQAIPTEGSNNNNTSSTVGMEAGNSTAAVVAGPSANVAAGPAGATAINYYGSMGEEQQAIPTYHYYPVVQPQPVFYGADGTPYYSTQPAPIQAAGSPTPHVGMYSPASVIAVATPNQNLQVPNRVMTTTIPCYPASPITGYIQPQPPTQPQQLSPNAAAIAAGTHHNTNGGNNHHHRHHSPRYNHRPHNSTSGGNTNYNASPNLAAASAGPHGHLRNPNNRRRSQQGNNTNNTNNSNNNNNLSSNVSTSSNHSNSHFSNQSGSSTINLYVSGLSSDTTDESFKDMCKSWGKIMSSKAIINNETNECKGFGFVMYETEEQAKNAMDCLNERGYRVSIAKDSLSVRLKNLQDEESTNIYISNIPLNMSEEQFLELFSPHEVVSYTILKDQNGVSRGVGFARFETRAIAKEIIDKYNNVKLEGASNSLQVRFADSNAQKRLKEQVSNKKYNITPKIKYQNNMASPEQMITYSSYSYYGSPIIPPTSPLPMQAQVPIYSQNLYPGMFSPMIAPTSPSLIYIENMNENGSIVESYDSQSENINSPVTVLKSPTSPLTTNTSNDKKIDNKLSINMQNKLRINDDVSIEN